MDRGNDFLKSQVYSVAVLHHAFVKALEDHESQAEDARYRDLCTRYIPTMRDHQQMLDDYLSELGGPGGGVLKRAVGTTVGLARNLADAAHESEYVRLANDLTMSRQAEETFRIFRDAGRALSLPRLAQIGDEAERDHDSYNRDANRLVQQMFVERARTGGVGATVEDAPDARR